ncbi:MAG: L-threonylcarbamoyladenylate synthase, partial [Balneolaceae bacterium]
MKIAEAVTLIKQGEIVAFPTETVYGLGADAHNPDAISKIFEMKGRPADNPLIVHLADPKQVVDFAMEIPAAAKKLMEICWPGPLTLIFKKKPEVPDAVTAGLSTVAIRVPDHPVALELIRQTGPLAAPSANRSGSPSPTKAEHVRTDFGSEFPVLDGGMSEIGLESTVLDVSETPFTILRPGKYTAEELFKITGKKVQTGQKTGDKPKSPGIQYTHYKPKAIVQWYDTATLSSDKDQVLLITHTQHPRGYPHHKHMKGN